jgi:class 3 adenylate cyclase/tetratricopeptide (TPR) repeat protein
LTKDDIDGLCTGGPRSGEPARELWGLNPRWSGGAAAQCLIEAALAIDAGLCTTGALVYGNAQRSIARHRLPHVVVSAGDRASMHSLAVPNRTGVWSGRVVSAGPSVRAAAGVFVIRCVGSGRRWLGVSSVCSRASPEQGEAMHCVACGSTNPDTHRFCDNCGVSLSSNCSACGAATRPESRYCGQCGAMLARSVQHPADSERSDAPAFATTTFTSERKHVTILFADVKDSTKLIDGLDPEQASARLAPILDAMTEAVHRHGGVVNQFEGDGIMALFGAPQALEDHAVWACHAALAARDAVRRLPAVPDLEIRVGLHSGEVLIRSMGTDFSVDYVAQGHTVHLAKRMEQAANPMTICLSTTTNDIASPFIESRSLGHRPVKGVDAPVEIFELIRMRPVPSRWAARAASGLTRFVGRSGEIATLRRCLEEAGAGRGQVVGIVGEPGVGKSRILHEFLAQVTDGRWTILAAAATEYDRNSAYKPLADLLRSWGGAREDDTSAVVAGKIRDLIEKVDPSLQPTVAALETSLDLPVSDPSWARLSSNQRRLQIANAVTTLIIRAADAQPVILIVEDLHWIDEATIAILDKLVTGIRMVPLLVVSTYRPEFRGRWVNQPHYTHMRLDPLEHATATELLTDLLGPAPELARLKEELVRQSGGTPLFLEEMVKGLIATGALTGARGDQRLGRPVADLQIPLTVQAVLAARIDRLPPAHRNLLQLMSAIGADVPWPLLSDVAGLDPDLLATLLADLQTGGLVDEIQRQPTLLHRFRHALTRDVTYGSMLVSRRRQLHAQLVDAIKIRYESRLDEHVERLAHHAILGERWEEAARYCHQAGSKANQRSAYREAIRSLERGLEALDRIASTPELRVMAIDMRLSLRIALVATGDFDRVRRLLEEVEQIANDDGDHSRLTRVCIDQTIVLSVLGQLDRAIEKGRRARDLAVKAGNPILFAASGFALAQALWFGGDLSTAIALGRADRLLLETGLRHAGHETTGSVSVLSLCTLANALTLHGLFAEAAEVAGLSSTIARESARPYDLCYAGFSRGFVSLVRDHAVQALPDLTGAYELARTAGIDVLQPFIAGQFGRALVGVGRLEDAIRVLSTSLNQARSQQLVFFQPWCEVALAEAYLAEGRLSEALDVATAALAHSRGNGYRAVTVMLLELLGRVGIALRDDGWDAADGYLNDAVGLSQEIGMRPWLLRSHEAQHILCRARGQIARADVCEVAAARLRAELGERAHSL